MRKETTLAATAFAVAWTGAVHAAEPGTADRDGKGPFHRYCEICHHPAGPYDLANVYGQRAGSQPGHFYSAAMLKAGADGLVWTPQNLDTFIAKPTAFLPRTSMGAFPGLKDPKARAEVIAHLRALANRPAAK